MSQKYKSIKATALDPTNKLQAEFHPDDTPVMIRETVEETVPNLEVRIGAIYSLERIAQDSLRDHIQIMEVLCAYVRQNTPAGDIAPSEDIFSLPTPRSDIQTAITVIGRRSNAGIKKEWDNKFRLDLSNTNLSHIDFKKGNFSAALFNDCRIVSGNFSSCNLTGVRFIGTLLNYSNFNRTELRGTNFNHAIINRPISERGQAIYSILHGNIYGVSLAGANIQAINYLGGPKEVNHTFGTMDTLIHQDLIVDFKLIEAKRKKIRKTANREMAQTMESEMYDNIEFASWAAIKTEYFYDYQQQYHEFMKRLGLTMWPYTDD